MTRADTQLATVPSSASCGNYANTCASMDDPELTLRLGKVREALVDNLFGRADAAFYAILRRR